MKINTVAIIGTGAIGAYFVWGLGGKLKDNLWIIADGKRKDRLEKEGLIINGKRHALNVRTPQEAKGADVLLIATKYGALHDILDDVSLIADEHTIVMSLLNGVDSEAILAERINKNQIIYSFMKIASQRVGNEITFDGPSTQGIFFGEEKPKACKTGDEKINSYNDTDRINALIELFSDTRLNYKVCDDIQREMWFKYALNVSKNQPQAIINCGVGAYEDSKYVAFISEKLRDEVVAVAAAKGVDISEAESNMAKGSKTLKAARYSTLQDLDAGRHTEVDMFAGAMVRMGKELGIATPYNEYTYNAIKAIEERNDGKFNY